MTDPTRRPRSAAAWHSFNAEVIEEYRSNGGRVARFGGLRIIVLHTVGARTGRVREIPLIVVERGGELLVYGTAEGAPRDPAWVHNLRAKPEIAVELDGDVRRAVFEELSAGEAAAIVAAHAEHTPQLATYVASATPRPIPVFRVHVVGATT